VFEFDPLDFQVNSWETVDYLDNQRHADGESKAAVFSAPTGFGKTEAFLGPLYQLLREDRQESILDRLSTAGTAAGPARADPRTHSHHQDGP